VHHSIIQSEIIRSTAHTAAPIAHRMHHNQPLPLLQVLNSQISHAKRQPLVHHRPPRITVTRGSISGRGLGDRFSILMMTLNRVAHKFLHDLIENVRVVRGRGGHTAVCAIQRVVCVDHTARGYGRRGLVRWLRRVGRRRRG
jgi:hypothetical protein